MPSPSKTYRLISGATTNLTSVHASDTSLNGVVASNGTAGVLFLKLYDKASAPVLASDKPKLVIAIPANNTFQADWPRGVSFSKGLALAIVKGKLDDNAEAVAAGDVSVTLYRS